MTIKEFMYRHYVIGMLKGLDGRSYEILAPAPDYYFDKKSAQNDKIWEYRIVNPEHIQEPRLGIYDKTRCDGHWTHLRNYESFIKAGGRIHVLKNGINKNKMNWNDDDFEICNKSFNELFSELKPSQTIFIEEVGDVIKTFGILDMKIDDISLKANCHNFE